MRTGGGGGGGAPATGTAAATPGQALSRSWGGEQHPGTILVLLLGVLGVAAFVA
ncbi:hypothetical protein [Methanoculleus chikugoensis]|uniref:hypothetical protein n=1 Tax=Methanoculleus chikugoensis TaxID=118126 RepID=UPI000AEE7AE2|nr:hypothetical protein [Methanoculleus chikugoensis]